VNVGVQPVVRLTPPSLTTENLSCKLAMGAQMDPENTAWPWDSWKELSTEIHAEEGLASNVTS